MGRDTTASKRMAEKRSREKEAGLRRLNVAVTPEVINKLAELMKQHNCASQARLIELLVMHNSTIVPSRRTKEARNEVTDKIKVQPKTRSKKQPLKTPDQPPPTKAAKAKTKVIPAQQELLTAQMSLFGD